MYELVKRLMDLGVSSALLATLSPALTAIAVAVKLDSPGPALFRQKRLGRHGRIFEILKFRTMHKDAGVVIGADHTVVNRADDDRVTRVGKLLRHTSLDELPQLINVLVGEMSLVGPRPDLPTGLQVYNDEQRRKLEVRPGITGHAQVSGRNLLTAQEKWALDVEYVDRAGVVMDISILAKTAIGVLTRKGIYK